MAKTLDLNVLSPDLSAALDALSDGFMVPDIQQGLGLCVECEDGSTDFLPEDVIGVFGHAIGEDLTDEEVSQLADYVEGTPESATVICGWFGRMRAPGYMDCTSWEFADNYTGIAESLVSAYGNE